MKGRHSRCINRSGHKAKDPRGRIEKNKLRQRKASTNQEREIHVYEIRK
jgi:hypothetical protein